jgi:hypothetical protein
MSAETKTIFHTWQWEMWLRILAAIPALKSSATQERPRSSYPVLGTQVLQTQAVQCDL